MSRVVVVILAVGAYGYALSVAAAEGKRERARRRPAVSEVAGALAARGAVVPPILSSSVTVSAARAHGPACTCDCGSTRVEHASLMGHVRMEQAPADGVLAVMRAAAATASPLHVGRQRP